MTEPTLKEIGVVAHDRTQAILRIAKDNISLAENALAEVASAPYFTNGLAGAIKDGHAAATKLRTDVERMSQQVHKHFNPPTVEVEVLKGEK